MDVTNLLNAQTVRAAYDDYRDNNLLKLSTSPIAQVYLGQSFTRPQRIEAVQALLEWAVEQIRPLGEHSFTEPKWSYYNVMHHFYIKGWSWEKLAQQMYVTPKSLYDYHRKKAITQILEDVFHTPQRLTWLKRRFVTDIYQTCPAEQQTILRISAIFPSAYPKQLLSQLAQGTIPNPEHHIFQLHNAQLLSLDDTATIVTLTDPDLRHYLRMLLTPDKSEKWHISAGDYYCTQGSYLTAAYHYCQANTPNRQQTAAELLLQHQAALIDNSDLQELHTALSVFTPHSLPEPLWGKIQLMSGRVAELSGEFDDALKAYRQALGVKDTFIRTHAHYLYGKALQNSNIDETLLHYQRAIELLPNLATTTLPYPNNQMRDVLARTYIDRAWIYMQRRPDLVKAEQDLANAG